MLFFNNFLKIFSNTNKFHLFLKMYIFLTLTIWRNRQRMEATVVGY